MDTHLDRFDIEPYRDLPHLDTRCHVQIGHQSHHIIGEVDAIEILP